MPAIKNQPVPSGKLTKEFWNGLSSYERDQVWYNGYKHMTRKEFKLYIERLFIVPEVVPQSEQSKYLQTVYKFRDGKVLHCGVYEDITGGILNNVHTALKWKYPNISREETKTILQSIK